MRHAQAGADVTLAESALHDAQAKLRGWDDRLLVAQGAVAAAVEAVSGGRDA